MPTNDNAGKISKNAFVASSIPFLALAILAALIRLAVRLRSQRHLSPDDYFLLFALLNLCIAAGLTYRLLPSMYLVEAVITDDPALSLPADFVAQGLLFQKLSDGFLVLTYNVIFAVKFSFLFFFRGLIRRVRTMAVYWWIVAAFTAAVWAFGVIGVFASCPYFDFRSLQCAQASQLPLALGLSASMIALDILTDILIITIPLRLLWNVSIRLQQKVAIGTTLCLSLAMIITAIIQVSSIRTSTNAIDILWEIFWQLVEACIAILMVSLTALRSFFVGQGSRVRKSPSQSWSERQAKRWLRREKAGIGEDELPQIPRATLTGIRTFIRGGSFKTMESLMGRESVARGDPWDLPPLARTGSRV